MRFFFFLLLTLFSLSIIKGLHFFKDGFSPRRIQPIEIFIDAEWDDEICQILEKPFHYLGRGRQCFAFESSDGKFVLKLPRTDIYKTPLWVRALPLSSYRKQLEQKHAKKMDFFFSSVAIASNELKTLSGVIATHLGQSQSKQKLTLIDSLGCSHRFALGQTAFILQHKWPLLTEVFLSALQKEDKEKAKKVLDSLIDVIEEMAQKGIFTKDPSFLRNYGFDGQTAHPIDIGTFYKKPTLYSYRDLIDYSVNPIRQWLTKTNPEMAEHLKHRKIDRTPLPVK
jgi:hypothetical protein